MTTSTILSDNGVSSGSSGLKTSGGNDGTLVLQTTTSGGTATTAVTIDTSQNVGIGTSSPAAKLDIVGNIKLNGYSVFGGATSTAVNLFAGTAFNTGGASVSFRGTTNGYNNGGIEFYTGSGATGNEVMRIDSSGNLLVGTTSTNPTKGAVCALSSNGSFWTNATDVSTNWSHWSFKNSNGVVGQINTSGSGTTYTTSSDYRLKHDIQPMTGALAKVALLKPVTYKWNADDSDGEGFIAHELQAVVPDCVTGEKDAVDADGNPVYQGIDTSFLVATLTAAIQEQQTIIQQLRADVAQLKGAQA